MPVYENTCTNCGKTFTVDSKSKHDTTNLRKFKRACSDECTRQLKSLNMSALRLSGTIIPASPKLREIDEHGLERMYCRELMLVKEIANVLKAKESTVSRELHRHGLTGRFIRTCPQCECDFAVPSRSMCNPSSSKFKKFCSQSCFLSSRNQSGTWIERAISDYLSGIGIPFTPQVEFGRMTVDFYVESIKLAIEANGDFWHANPDVYGKEKPLHRFHKRIIGKDARKIAALAKLNITVYTIWEKDLRENKESTLAELRKFIEFALKGAA